MLVFTSFSQSPWPVAHLGLLAGIGTRVVHSREFAGGVATHWVTPPPDDTHHVDRSLHLLEAIGVPARGGRRAAGPGRGVRGGGRLVGRRAVRRRRGRRALRRAGTPTTRAPVSPAGPHATAFALLVPGASCASRRYPAARFGAAAAGIAAPGLPVLVAGTAAEAGLVEEVVRAAGTPDVRALPATGLPVFTALVARAAVALDQQLRRPAPRRRGRHSRRGRPTRAPSGSATSPRGRCRPRCCRSRRPARPAGSSPVRSTSSASTSRRSGSSPRHSGWRRPAAALATPVATSPAPAASPSGGPASDVPASASPQEDRWPHIPTPWIA